MEYIVVFKVSGRVTVEAASPAEAQQQALNDIIAPGLSFAKGVEVEVRHTTPSGSLSDSRSSLRIRESDGR